jgi:hypothetical protein
MGHYCFTLAAPRLDPVPPDKSPFLAPTLFGAVPEVEPGETGVLIEPPAVPEGTPAVVPAAFWDGWFDGRFAPPPALLPPPWAPPAALPLWAMATPDINSTAAPAYRIFRMMALLFMTTTLACLLTVKCVPYAFVPSFGHHLSCHAQRRGEFGYAFVFIETRAGRSRARRWIGAAGALWQGVDSRPDAAAASAMIERTGMLTDPVADISACTTLTFIGSFAVATRTIRASLVSRSAMRHGSEWHCHLNGYRNEFRTS